MKRRWAFKYLDIIVAVLIFLVTSPAFGAVSDPSPAPPQIDPTKPACVLPIDLANRAPDLTINGIAYLTDAGHGIVGTLIIIRDKDRLVIVHKIGPFFLHITAMTPAGISQWRDDALMNAEGQVRETPGVLCHWIERIVR